MRLLINLNITDPSSHHNHNNHLQIFRLGLYEGATTPSLALALVLMVLVLALAMAAVVAMVAVEMER